MLFKNLNKVALALAMTLFLGACATQQATTTTTTKGDDAYTGTETV
ncbi:MAG: peptidoglycan-associated lipoprotein, partial [Proteobacteria bacterium]|nr:peptidoglycan-associated lipoprotein [Candidatus Fonsibacter sp. PEL3]